MTDAKMFPAGELEVMGDESAAMLIGTAGTKANAAVIDVIAPVAADVVAGQPTVVAAVVASVDAEVSARGLVSSQTIEEDAFLVRFKGSSVDVIRATEEEGITSKITHQEDSVPPEALTTMEPIPDESSWLFGFFGNNSKAFWGRRNDGSWYGMDAFVLKEAVAPTVLEAVGDSTTFGAGGTDDEALATTDTWVYKASASTGLPINNWGSSGAKAQEITARVGGIAPTANVVGGVIPASGPVLLENMSVIPLRANNVFQYEVELITSTGVRIRGTLKKVSSTSNSFTRLDSGAAIPVQGLVDVVSVFGQQVRKSRLILGMGINDKDEILAGTRTLADLKRWYSAATTGLANRPIVWGVLDRGTSEAVGTVWGNTIRDLEQWLAEKYGSDFLPIRQYLASSRALTDALIYSPSFAPSQADLDAVAVGTVPPSFRVNPTTVHLNALGHSLQAGRLRYHLYSKGLV